MSEEAQEQTLFKGSSSPIKNLGTFIICGLIAVAALVFAFMLPSPLAFSWTIGVGSLSQAARANIATNRLRRRKETKEEELSADMSSPVGKNDHQPQPRYRGERMRAFIK